MYLGTDRPGKLMVDNLSAFLVTSPLTSSNATFLYDGQTYLQEACRDMSEDGNNFKFHKIAAAGEYPPARFGHSMSYLATTSTVAVFGGLQYA